MELERFGGKNTQGCHGQAHQWSDDGCASPGSSVLPMTHTAIKVQLCPAV